jgi:Ribbon-helix-helix protein, copG family
LAAPTRLTRPTTIKHPPRKRPTTVALPPDQLASLRRLAAGRLTSVSQLVRTYVRDGMAREESRRAT